MSDEDAPAIKIDLASIGQKQNKKSKNLRNGSSLQPSSRSNISYLQKRKTVRAGSQIDQGSSTFNQHKLSKTKYLSPDREKFRYNMIYNKMHHILNDESQKKKRQINGSRNLSTQAKLMITQPSATSFTYDGGELSPVSSTLRFTSRQTPTNMTILPKLSSSPLANINTIKEDRNSIDGIIDARKMSKSPFELQPQQKSSTYKAVPLSEELEAITRRKGKVVFTNNSMAKVSKPDDTDDISLAFKKDQQLLT